jgi:hypothetical protein
MVAIDGDLLRVLAKCNELPWNFVKW